MPDKSDQPRGFRIFPQKAEVEVDDELTFHLEERVRDYVARGMDPESARAAALERLGDLHTVRQECTQMLEDDRRVARRRDWIEDLRQDLRYGVRSALRAPLFSLLAIITLALGIGANAAVFGVVKSVLLDALPYRDADRLVRVYARWTSAPAEAQSVSPGVAQDFAQRLRSFSSVAAFNFSAVDVTYADANGPRVLSGALVGGTFFSTLGTRAALGRTLTEGDLDGPSGDAERRRVAPGVRRRS